MPAPQLLRPTPLLRAGTGAQSRTLTMSNSLACPLCLSKRTTFYCADCVINGDFVHSGTRLFERFSEKNLRLFSLQRENATSKADIVESVKDTWTKKKLKEDIKVARTNVKYYKHIISKTLEKRTLNLQLLNKLKASNQRRTARLPKFEDKAVRMEQCADTFLEDLRKTREVLLTSRHQLRLSRAAFVLSLQEQIFPISEVLPAAPQSSPDLVLDCLADAMRTSYIHGRWVTGDTSGELHFRIVAPLLSGCGDYTAVYAWVASNKPSGGAGGVADGEFANPAHTIAAGLALVCQLTSLAAAHIGLVLPARINYQDFGVLETSEFRFARKVAKLNSNVVTLCLSLGLPPACVRPCHTLHNIQRTMQRLQRGEIGHAGEGFDPKEVPRELMVSWEGQIHREAEELRLAQVEESEDSDTEVEAEGGWVECDQEQESADAARRMVEEEEEERRRSLDRQSSIVSSVSSLLWGLAQSPKSPKK